MGRFILALGTGGHFHHDGYGTGFLTDLLLSQPMPFETTLSLVVIVSIGLWKGVELAKKLGY